MSTLYYYYCYYRSIFFQWSPTRRASGVIIEWERKHLSNLWFWHLNKNIFTRIMILQIYPITERNLLLHTTVSDLKHHIYFDCHFSIEASKPTVRVKSLELWRTHWLNKDKNKLTVSHNYYFYFSGPRLSCTFPFILKNTKELHCIVHSYTFKLRFWVRLVTIAIKDISNVRSWRNTVYHSLEYCRRNIQRWSPYLTLPYLTTSKLTKS